MNGDIDFKIEPTALSFIQKAQQQLEESAVNGDSIYGAAIGRAVPYAFKIAMLLELGKREPCFEISLQSMKQSFELVVNYFIPTLLDVTQRLEEDIRKNDISKVLFHLKRKNGVATHSALLHDTKMISRVFKECIETMIESGTVEIIHQKDSKVTWYKLNTQNSPIPKIPSILCFSDITLNTENLENSDKQIKKDDIIDDTRVAPTYKNTTVREAENSENSGNRENCGCCEQPLNGSRVPGLRGSGDWHPTCIELHRKAIRLLHSEYDKPAFFNPDKSDIPHLLEVMDLKLENEFEMDSRPAKLAVQAFCRERGWRTQ